MKKVIKIILVLNFIAFISNAWCETKTEGWDIWVTFGQEDGTVSFTESYPSSWRSELDFDTDGIYMGLGGYYRFINSPNNWSKLSLYFDMYKGNDFTGECKDTDYLTSPSSIYKTTYIYSESPCKTEHSQYDINAGFQLFNIKEGLFTLDAHFGYYYNSYNKFQIDEVTTKVSNYVTIYNIVRGHASTYAARFTGNYLGLSTSLSFGKMVKVYGSFKYLPDLRATGEGFWELRELWFKQEGKGDGYLFDAGLNIMPKDNWYIGIRVTKTHIKAEDGKTENYRTGLATDNFTHITHTYTDTWLGSNDLEELLIDSLRTELKVGYKFG